MKKKRRIWILAAVLAVAAAQGTVFAEEQESGSTETAVTKATVETTETEILETEVLVETAKEQISDDKQEQAEIKKTGNKQFKQARKPEKKTADGQTLLDVSKGNITITSAGVTGGGYKR